MWLGAGTTAARAAIAAGASASRCAATISAVPTGGGAKDERAAVDAIAGVAGAAVSSYTRPCAWQRFTRACLLPLQETPAALRIIRRAFTVTIVGHQVSAVDVGWWMGGGWRGVRNWRAGGERDSDAFGRGRLQRHGCGLARGLSRAHTDAVELCGSTYAMRATPLSPSPRCRRLVAEPDRLKLNSRRHVRRTRIAFLDGPCNRLCRAGEEVHWAAWALHDTRSAGPCRATGVLRNPRICAVVQKRGRRGGHPPQGSVGGQLVIRTRLGSVCGVADEGGRCGPTRLWRRFRLQPAGADGLECPSHQSNWN